MGRKRSTTESIPPENGMTTDAPKNKTEAVKRAISGGLTSPTEIVARVKEEYGMDVTPGLVSTIKSTLKRRKPKGKPGRKPRQATDNGVPPARAVATRGLLPEDLVALSALAEKAGGVDQLQEFLGVLKKIR